MDGCGAMTGKITVVHYCSVWLEITQTWLYNQVKFLPAHIDNHIVCRSTRNLDQFAVDNIQALKNQRFGSYLLYKLQSLVGKKGTAAFFRQRIVQLKPDIVHSHFGNNGWAILDAVKKSGAQHFVTFYGQDVEKLPKDNPVWLTRYRQLFDAPETQFLCEGPHMAARLVEMGCPEEKTHVHHLGVDVDKIHYQPRRWQSGEQLKVLIAASFREKKGIPYAIEALGRLAKELPLQITIVGDAGKTKDGDEQKRLILAAIDKWQLAPVSRMLGYQPQAVLWREAYAHHLFLSPSVSAVNGDTEGGAPISIIEMVASGMPIVSSFHCDIPSVIKHGETGWLARERDVDGILTCLHRWVDKPQEWVPMLSAGRRHIEQNYDVAVQGEKLARHYLKSLGA